MCVYLNVQCLLFLNHVFHITWEVNVCASEVSMSLISESDITHDLEQVNVYVSKFSMSFISKSHIPLQCLPFLKHIFHMYLVLN